MSWLRSIVREVVGLFVDDGSFALAILLWVVVAVAVLPRLAPAAMLHGLTLFAGLVAILVHSVLRFAGSNRR